MSLGSAEPPLRVKILGAGARRGAAGGTGATAAPAEVRRLHDLLTSSPLRPADQGSESKMHYFGGAAVDHAGQVEKAGLSATGAKRRVPHAAVSVSAPLDQRLDSMTGAWPPRFNFERRLMQTLARGAAGIVSILL